MPGEPPKSTVGSSPPQLRLVQVAVPLAPGAQPTLVTVPAGSPDEAMRLLHDVGNGVPAGVAWGSVLEPIRKGYKRQLEQVELQIRERRAALGAEATEYELRGLAQWAARQRALTARLWRLPLPVTGVGLEARDWRKFGIGGRTVGNMIARNAAQGRTGLAAYENIIGSATRSNPEFNASIARGATLFRRGGGVLAVAGLAVTAHDIWAAPPGQRLHVAERHGVGFAGGLIGSEVAGGLLMIGAGLLLATPPGWIVLAVGLIGGVVGSVIADHVFYPEEYRPAAERMRAGIAIDPRHVANGTVIPGGMAPTRLAVVRQIELTVRPGETPTSLAHRAQRQAAASAGLAVADQNAFADRNGGVPNWLTGDPTPQDGREMHIRDIALSAGKRIIYQLSPSQQQELGGMAGP